MEQCKIDRIAFDPDEGDDSKTKKNPGFDYMFKVFYDYEYVDEKDKKWIRTEKDIFYTKSSDLKIVDDTDAEKKFDAKGLINVNSRLEPNWYISKMSQMEKDDAESTDADD